MSKKRSKVSEAAPVWSPTETATIETTVFRSGNSDAVRLPKRFALSGTRVRVRRLPGGRLLIEPVRKRRWPTGFLESFGTVTADFAAPERPAASASDEARAGALFTKGRRKR
jgi:virulence-associated protein VagC